MKNALLLTALIAAAGAAQAQSATYAIDPTHTQVFFEAKHFGTSTNRGRFDKSTGTVTLDKAAKTGKVELTIEMASISTGIGPFDGHLKSKDFFNVEQHPTATFVGDKFTFNGDKVTSVAGTLTLLGKANPVTLTASGFNCYENPRLKREVCGGDFETTIQRSQWGMAYGLPGIPDNVRLLIQAEAIKQ
ncbi:YceI family protein [Roseateles sp. DC23W]|uniref:YceI family protein n=1 Tax=Pelomonas dachongensis TaxID=3299029 RepID=A0ABW7EGN9_9BURK